MQIATKRQ